MPFFEINDIIIKTLENNFFIKQKLKNKILKKLNNNNKTKYIDAILENLLVSLLELFRIIYRRNANFFEHNFFLEFYCLEKEIIDIDLAIYIYVILSRNFNCEIENIDLKGY